ncbi:MAG: thiolase domain-containing protein [Thermoplasmata archaeon]
MSSEGVAIIGAGRTKFGELFDKSLMNLITEASNNALKDANLDWKDIDEIVIGSFVPEIINNIGNLPALMSEELSLNIPITRVEAACGSGGAAIYNAIRAVKGGGKNVLAIGAEKSTDGDARSAYMAAANPWEHIYGFDFAGLNAAMTERYFYEYPKTKREQFAMVSVKNHKHAAGNKLAHLRNQITIETVLNANIISYPVRLFDCSPVSDGAAAVVLTSEERAKKEYKDKGVKISGYGMISDTIGLYARESFVKVKATRLAARDAFKRAGYGIEKVDLLELHDAFVIQEILALEELGLANYGEAPKMVEDSFDANAKYIVYKTSMGDKISNTGGGLKGDGHPVGASGVRQAVELYGQITGKTDHPIDKYLGRMPRVGLCQSIGGSGSTITIHILEAM